MELPLAEHIPPEWQGDAQRLLRISPLFSSLLRDAPAEECRMLFKPLNEALLPDASETWVPHCDSTELTECMRHLRGCKRRGMRHIIWWELGVHGDIGRSCTAIADFAAGLLDEALAMAARLLVPRYGRPNEAAFCVIGLGKLGGHELNLGSDVDLLFVWRGDGETTGGQKSVPVEEYFGLLSRMLIRLLSEPTAEGIVWSVDMRLRPGGDAATICLSLDATADYYQNYGQTWERAMLIKARPVAGDLSLGEELVEDIAPFIYRRYLDYTTVAALADMKRRIDTQAGKRVLGTGFDVKRGRGGIREIEFIIQSMQLLHGGANPGLRLPGSITALEALRAFGALDDAEAGMLRQAYDFWRRVEHAVQARLGEQTQRLPEDYAGYLEAALGITGIETLMRHWAGQVAEAFGERVLPMEAPGAGEGGWLNGEHGEELSRLDEAGRRRIEEALQRMDAQLERGMLPERSRGHVEIILARAMPRWLDDINGITALEALAELLNNIAGRATWVDLLATHEGALEWLIGALSASAYVREHIVRDPSWLEWPLAAERGDTDIRRIVTRMRALMLDDEEHALADIGRLVDRSRLLCALSVDAHQADVATIGGWMADTADAATEVVLRLCLRQMDLPEDFPFVTLAMGKHGSREMGLASDLDMVFVLVHDDPVEMLGRHSMWEHAQRLGRRLIQYLTGKPPFGAGFEFDARLRPSGQNGVLVTTLNGFRDYQLHEAQTWEHQVLCRARCVAGPSSAREAVGAVVAEVLGLPRDATCLAADVVEMRDKMLQHLGSKSPDTINLKQDAGGLVDIEFLAQFARLAFGSTWLGTVEILRHLPAGAPVDWQELAGALAASYEKYRQMENVLRVELWGSISRLPADPAATEWETMRRHADITTPAALREEMRRTRDCFNRLLGRGVSSDKSGL
jgi:[glutamine synthetase] adenylyltransferase / [glutamine synthetase]-adenylyl-L-tyrosine phosphorylase